jgi:hypothetical protein
MNIGWLAGRVEAVTDANQPLASTFGRGVRVSAIAA